MKQTQVNHAVVLEAIRKETAPIIKKVQGITISSQAEFAQAGEMLSKVKGALKLADQKKMELIDPLNKVVKDIRSLFKPFELQVEALEKDVKARMLEWVEYTKAQEKKLEEKFAAGDIKKVSTLTKKINDLSTTNAFSQVRRVWTAIEVDGTKTPREYMVPDVAKIKEALKSGKKVAGWSWEQVENIAI